MDRSKQANIRGICGAKTRNGTPCQLPAGWGTDHPGIGRCKLHGGATPRGADSPHFKHGLHCRYLPPGTELDVTEEELLSAYNEVAGAIKWLEKTSQIPGQIPVFALIQALRAIVDMKRRALELAERLQQPGGIIRQAARELAALVCLAMERAGVPPDMQRRVSEELQRLVSGHAGED